VIENPIISLITDFGVKDPFVGLMKGVILGINPKARLIDITHSVSRHSIIEASRIILTSYRYFPSHTIHIAVVDPGVGGSRRPIMAITDNYYFIGPDNGIFTPIFEETSPDFLKVLHLTSSDYFLPMSGSTFHGRDIFAPVAAWLSKGTDAGKFGELINDYEKISLSKPSSKNSNTLTGEIVSIDIFGNAISNITKDDLMKLAPGESIGRFKVTCSNQQLHVVNYYAENKSSHLTAIINSFGQLELFVYKGDAAAKFDIKIGDSVIISVV
jgi:S-adenosylmethionine hydrolase